MPSGKASEPYYNPVRLYRKMKYSCKPKIIVYDKILSTTMRS